MQEGFSIGASVRYGWETFKKRPWLFIGVLILFSIASTLSGTIAGEASKQGGMLAILVNALDLLVVQVLLAMGLIAFTLRFHDDASTADIRDFWRPKMYWSFLGMSLLSLIIVVLGLIALIIPGIVLALGLMFSQYLVVDKEMGAVGSLKESWRITKGSRWNLLLLVLLLALINVVGALALLVGLLVSIPVTMLAIVHAYRTLEHRASELAPSAGAIGSVA